MENTPFTFTLACAQTLAFGTPSISFPDGSQSDFPLLSTDWETYKTLACVVCTSGFWPKAPVTECRD